MKILVINAGSSSLKFQLIDMDDESVKAKGLVERIGIEGTHFKQTVLGTDKVIEFTRNMKDHTEAISAVLSALTDKDNGAITSLDEIGACGHRVLTASSGPGISLKQEGISYMNQMNFPAVILNVVRWGNGLGALNGSQTDYHRETRGGGNGDYRNIILCPSTVQESVDLMYEAFDIAEKYRCIVEIMSESGLGQMMEPCEYPEFRELKKCDWGLDGTYKVKRGGFLGRDLQKESDTYMAKVRAMRENEQRWEARYTEDAEYVFVAYGLPGRAVSAQAAPSQPSRWPAPTL